MTSLADSLDSKRNTLNFVRLVLASAVIYRHAQVVTSGTVETSNWNSQIFGQMPVDGFFAVSGYLIAGSWIRNPQPRQFLASRIARIYPAFWACLVVTGFCIAPLAASLGGYDWTWSPLSQDGPFGYVFKNASLVIFQNDILLGPSEVPWEGDWNGSLWTLKWEFACYVAVFLVGMCGLLAKRWFSVALFVLLWTFCAFGAVHFPEHGTVDDFSRLALMYVSGVLLYNFARWVPVAPSLVVLSGAAALTAGIFAPDYRLVGSLPLAYSLIAFGAIVTTPALRFQNDISYGMYVYGFPVEQLLAHTVMVSKAPWLFSLVAIATTLPFACLSWYILEKPVLNHVRARRRASRSGQAPEYGNLDPAHADDLR